MKKSGLLVDLILLSVFVAVYTVQLFLPGSNKSASPVVVILWIGVLAGWFMFFRHRRNALRYEKTNNAYKEQKNEQKTATECPAAFCSKKDKKKESASSVNGASESNSETPPEKARTFVCSGCRKEFPLKYLYKGNMCTDCYANWQRRIRESPKRNELKKKLEEKLREPHSRDPYAYEREHIWKYQKQLMYIPDLSPVGSPPENGASPQEMERYYTSYHEDIYIDDRDGHLIRASFSGPAFNASAASRSDWNISYEKLYELVKQYRNEPRVKFYVIDPADLLELNENNWKEWLSAHFGPNAAQSLTIPAGTTSIKDGMYEEQQSITQVTIPEGVTSIGNKAFGWCKTLQSVTIPRSVTSIGNQAFCCTNLQSVTIPEGVTSIGDEAFYCCTNLQSVTIPGSVTSISDGAFGSCKNLQSVTIPGSVTSIGERAFNGCTSLQSVTIPEGVTSIGIIAFHDCSSLESLTVASGNKKFHSAGNCIIETRSKTLIVGCATSVIPTDGSVETIGKMAFAYASGLKEITIPASVKTIDDRAFSNCGLLHINLSAGVEKIGEQAFHNCRWLTNITIPMGVTSIGSWAFHTCTNLTSVTIPEGVSSIGEYAFCDCTSLQSVTIPGSVTSIGERAFYGCTSLQSVTIPEGVSSIGRWAFYGCTSLQSVSIPKSVTSIGDYAFYKCTSLKTLNYSGNSSQWARISIGDNESMAALLCYRHRE